MTIMNGAQIGSRNRNHGEFSFPLPDERRRDALLRTAWVNIVAGFKCRPSPRGPWDETASGDQTPWKYVVAPIRAALARAVVMGDQQLIEQTLEAARAFCRELEADFASMVPAAEEGSIVSEALAETESQGPADAVQMALVARPDPTNADRAIKPLERQHERLGALIRKCRRDARQITAQMAACVMLTDHEMNWSLAGRMTVWTLLAFAGLVLIAIPVARWLGEVSNDYPSPEQEQDYEEGTEPPRAA
jgi:hypothetical protein